MRFYVFCALFTVGATVGIWQVVALRRDADRVVNAVDSLRFHLAREKALEKFMEKLGEGKTDRAWLNRLQNDFDEIPRPADGGAKPVIDADWKPLPEPVWDDAKHDYVMPEGGAELRGGPDTTRRAGF